MYINQMQFDDFEYMLDASDYDASGNVKLDSANRLINKLNSIYSYRDIELIEQDLQPERLLAYIRLRYNYISVSVMRCEYWGIVD